MRKYTVIVFLLLAIIILACKSSVTENKNPTPHERFIIIIDNYYNNNNSDIKKYDVFSVDEKFSSDKNYYLYSVLPLTEQNFYTMWQKKSYLPSDYIDYKGKYFYYMIKKSIMFESTLIMKY